ncbi:hypothetical protein BaRGS_00014898 [Batillaria attramentaria]|uniref:Uncharacterized protein n=1 Tax=Batillaria attramentaria TaxID=370345 RepID=A0ABD0L2W6_9CAEN
MWSQPSTLRTFKLRRFPHYRLFPTPQPERSSQRHNFQIWPNELLLSTATHTGATPSNSNANALARLLDLHNASVIKQIDGCCSWFLCGVTWTFANSIAGGIDFCYAPPFT